MTPTPESVLQTAILRTFASRPDIRLWRQNTGRAIPVWALSRLIGHTITAELIQRLPRISFGLPGAADDTGILPDGRRLEIELKSPTGKQTKQQLSYQRMIARFGGVYILARSVDDVHRGLSEHGYSQSGNPAGGSAA